MNDVLYRLTKELKKLHISKIIVSDELIATKAPRHKGAQSLFNIQLFFKHLL